MYLIKTVIGCSYDFREFFILKGDVSRLPDKNIVVNVTLLEHCRNTDLQEAAIKLNKAMGSGLKKEGWITPHEALKVRLRKPDEWNELSLNPKKPEDEEMIEILKDHDRTIRSQGNLTIDPSIDITKNQHCYRSYLLVLKGTHGDISSQSGLHA